MIYCCPGTGGLFLATIFAQMLGYDIQSRFSNTGHAHDMGSGNWRGADNICIIGDHWDINYRPGQPIYYSHVVGPGFSKQNPDVKIIKINTDSSDYKKVAEIYVNKAWPDLWTKEEYNKWASPDYPPYSKDNIHTSELIRSDLINDIEITTIKKWHNDNAAVPAYAEINFKTIMGIDNNDLVAIVRNITGLNATNEIQHYVQQYQQLNQGLYFAGQT